MATRLFSLSRIVAALICGLSLVACTTSNGDNSQERLRHPKARPSATAPTAPAPTPIPAAKAKTTVSQPATSTTTAPAPTVRPINSALIIDKAVGPREARLPCNQAGTGTPSPHCDLRIYQVYVGTFVDGAAEHNSISGYGPGPHTGDIEGVTGALEHIKAMGFNTIWLTPIFDTKAGTPQVRADGSRQVNARLDGTGYFLRDYFNIDPQFGTLESARRLVNEAHGLGIKVIFDGVFGHHKGELAPSPTGLLPVDALTEAAYDGGRATYPGRIVEYNDPRSVAFYKEVARYWIDTLGIDGWRLDQVYQVPGPQLREINAEIKKASDAQLLSGYVVGEMWGSAQQIRDVLGPSDNPALMSAFDFPTRYALVQTLAGDENGNMGKPFTTINEGWAMGAHQTYPDHAIMNLMLGNHDLVRFGDLIQRAGKGDTSTQSYWDRHRMAFTFMAAWSGPITLYYGEEIGAEVGGFAAKVSNRCADSNLCDDHVGRNMVSIPGVNSRAGAATLQQRALKAYLTELMNLRAVTPALSSGSRTHIYSDTSLYVDLKSAGSEHYLLVMNKSDAPRVAKLTPSALTLSGFGAATVSAGSAAVAMDGQNLSITIPALGAAIIKVAGT